MRETIVCSDVTSTIRNTKNGPLPAFDLLGNTGEKFQCGFTNPANKGVEPGVTFTAEVARGGPYGPKINLNTVQLVQQGQAVPPPQTPDAPAPRQGFKKSEGKIFPVPPNHGDISIIRQNALARATELVTNYVEFNGSEEALDDFLVRMSDTIITLASKYADYSSGASILAQMKKETETE